VIADSRSPGGVLLKWRTLQVRCGLPDTSGRRIIDDVSLSLLQTVSSVLI